jgi:hypothetical protein
MNRGAGLRRWAIPLAALLVGAAWFGDVAAFFVAPDPRLAFESRHDIRHYQDLAEWPPEAGRVEVEGFVLCMGESIFDSGWCLPPGAQGVLRYRLPRVEDAKAMLSRVYFFRRDLSTTNRLRAYREDAPQRALVFDNVYFADARVDLSPVLSEGQGGVVLSFEGRNTSARPDVFVQYFEVRLFRDPLPAAPAWPRAAAATFLLGLCAIPWVSWKRLLPLWAVITLAFALRYVALLQGLYQPPDYDAKTFHDLARTMQLFSPTGFYSAQFANREPLHVFILHAALRLLGDSETHVKLVSLAASLVAVGLVYRVAAKVFGRGWGLCGGALMAVSLPLVRESARGLRLEVEIILLLLLVEAIWLGTIRPLWGRVIAAGCLGGLLVLLRTNYLLNLAPVLLIAFARRSPRSWSSAATAILLMAALAFPHRWNGYRRTGEWTWDQNARWWANVEFAGRPGWPTQLQMWRSVEGGGPRMTAAEYFFGLHTVPELAVGSLRGAWKLFRHMDLVGFRRGVQRLTGVNGGLIDGTFQALGALGLLLCASSRTRCWIPLVFVFVLAHLPFLYDRGMVEWWRHSYQAFPFMVLAVLAATQRLAALARGIR